MIDLHFVNETEWDAQDMRVAFEAFNEGVLGLADGALEVTAGATGLSIDVADGIGFVQGDTVDDQGLYRVLVVDPTNSEAFLDGGLEPADATNPRVDRIVARVYDDAIDDSGDTAFRLEVLPGVPTAGADLTNLDGADPVPPSAMLLANVQVPAAASSITSADVDDQRVSALAELAAGGPHGATHAADGTDPVPGVMTAAQEAAMDAANSPSGANPIATIADVGGGGGSLLIGGGQAIDPLTSDPLAGDWQDILGLTPALAWDAVDERLEPVSGGSSSDYSSVVRQAVDPLAGFKFELRVPPLANTEVSLWIKRLNGIGTISAYVEHSSSTGSSFNLDCFIDGTGTVHVDNDSAFSPLTPGNTYWIRGAQVGNDVTAELYDADPDVGSPAPISTLGFTLTNPAAVAALGDGVSAYYGLLYPNGCVAAWVDDLVYVGGVAATRLSFTGSGAAVVSTSEAPPGEVAVNVDVPPIPDVAGIVDAKGDLLVGTVADVLDRLPVGTDGKVLTADSGAAGGLSWQTPASGGLSEALLDAKGDLYAASGDNAAARVPVGADGEVLTADSSAPAGVTWQAPAPVLPSRDTVTVVTGALADGASATLLITLAPSFRLLQVETDRAARVQLYATPGDRTADAGRPIATDPTGDHGVIFDFDTIPGDLVWRLTPVVDGSSMETPPSADIAARITNLSGASSTVSVTLTFVPTEAS